MCCECKKDFCSLCSVLQENLRRCCTCQLLQETAFQRPQLMRLKVKDLRQYLVLRNIPTDTCREKEDLVELVLCHHGLAFEEDTDSSSLYSTRSQTSSFSTHPVSLAGSVSSSQGELATRHEAVGNELQVQVRWNRGGGGGGSLGLGRAEGTHVLSPPAGRQSLTPVPLCTQGQSERLFPSQGEEEEDAEEQVSCQVLFSVL